MTSEGLQDFRLYGLQNFYESQPPGLRDLLPLTHQPESAPTPTELMVNKNMKAFVTVFVGSAVLGVTNGIKL